MSVGTLILITRPVLGGSGSDSGPAFVFADVADPQLSVLDLAATRGDGIFESIGVSDGRPQALREHLARLAHSAAMLDLPEPDAAVWTEALLAGIAAHPAVPELFAKLVLSRGVEGGSPGADTPTAWIHLGTVEDQSVARNSGISVITLDRGYRHDVAQTSPWLLQGAKTLSYAVNRSAAREAARRGADDVLFLSSDGFLLEGPTSNVLLRFGDRIVTPRTDQGILAGTTQTGAFAFFDACGFETAYELVPAGAIGRADAAWLVSSVRLAAPVRRVDGRPLPVDAELTSRLNSALLARTR